MEERSSTEAKTISVVMAAADFNAYAPELLQSLEAQDTDDYHAIIVDDGSVDGCDVRSHERVMVLRNMKTLGWGRAMNQGIRLSLSRWGVEAEGKYILFTQPEIIFHEETLRRLREFLDRHADYAIASPAVYRAKRLHGPDDEIDIDFTDEILHSGFQLTRSRALRWVTGEEALFGPPPECFMIRADFLKRLAEGGLYFHEDAERVPAMMDLIWRARLLGGRSMSVEQTAVWKQVAPFPGKKTREDKRRELMSRLALHDVYAARSPFTLRLTHAPWLFAGFLARAAAILPFPELWGGYLRKPLGRFRVSPEPGPRIKAGGRASEMKNWFV